MFAKKWFRLTIAAFLLGLLGLIVFRDFVFGDKLLLYEDIGSDSVNSYYPDLVHFSRYLRTDGLPLWSFHAAMGQDLFQNIGALVFSPVTWFPPSAIAGLLVYQHLVYVFAAGLLFFRYLELRGLNFTASLSGSLLLGFSAYLCMGSCWTICAQEVLCIVFALFAIETALVRGDWIYLPFAAALFGLLVAFYLYLGAVLIGVYVIARVVAFHGRKSLSHVRLLVPFAIIAFLGIGLVAVVWLDNLVEVLNSARGPGAATYARHLLSSGVFTLESAQGFRTALLRPFSNDILGIGNQFRGWHNYFEAPISYCGLLTLLMVPQAFVQQGRKARILYALFLGAILMTTVFPWFRYLFWLFQGDYFRTLTLFAVIGAIVLTATALSRYVEKCTLNLWLLLGTLCVLLGLLYLPVASVQQLVDSAIRNLAALYLLIYAVVLAAGRLLKKESLCVWLLIAICVSELSYFDWNTVSPRPTVTKQELHEHLGYNDRTVDALRDIQARDDSFYRITKLYPSSSAQHDSLNDALVFGYYGTSSYSSFNSIHYIKFLIALGALPSDPPEIETRWTYGLLTRPLLSTFACEKYLLTRQPAALRGMSDYEAIQDYNGVYVFRNRSFLPLGLFYEDVIPEKLFASLSPSLKELALLHSAVVPDEFRVEGEPMTSDKLQQILEDSPVSNLLSKRREGALRIHHCKQSRIAGNIRCGSKGILIFQTTFDAGWTAMVDGARVPILRADVGLLGVPLREGEHDVEIRYLPRLLRIGLAISVLSAVLLFVGFRRWPRLTPLKDT